GASPRCGTRSTSSPARWRRCSASTGRKEPVRMLLRPDPARGTRPRLQRQQHQRQEKEKEKEEVMVVVVVAVARRAPRPRPILQTRTAAQNRVGRSQERRTRGEATSRRRQH
ncbi:hypothetical protein VTH06DRAFT_4646, partial [Thermothelomyces fergusii]